MHVLIQLYSYQENTRHLQKLPYKNKADKKYQHVQQLQRRPVI